MLWVTFQRGKLLIGAAADVRRERVIESPEIGSGAMLHQAAFLKRLNATVLLIVRGAVNRFVEMARG